MQYFIMFKRSIMDWKSKWKPEEYRLWNGIKTGMAGVIVVLILKYAMMGNETLDLNIPPVVFDSFGVLAGSFLLYFDKKNRDKNRELETLKDLQYKDIADNADSELIN